MSQTLSSFPGDAPAAPSSTTGVDGIFHRILQASMQLAEDSGLRALSVRNVAALSGCSPSAVMYNHGSISQLAQRVAAQCAADLAAWRAQQLQSLERAETPITPEGFVLSAMSDLTGARRGMILLRDELLIESEFPTFQEGERANGQFWEHALSLLGCSPVQAVTWADFVTGLLSGALLDRSPASLFTWMPLMVRRFADRMARRATFDESEFPFHPSDSDRTVAPTAEGARKILDATISLIAENGVDQLTHRAVAARAKLSVAACTYFFSSRVSMIMAAVDELSRRLRDRTRLHLDDRPMEGIIRLDCDDLHVEMKALLALHVPAARHLEFAPLGRQLFALRGPAALERLHHDAVLVDRLDSVLSATTMTGALHPTRIPQHDLLERLEDRAALHLANLFQKDVGKGGK